MNIPISLALVQVYDAPDQTTAEIVCATLQAAGINAYLTHQHQGVASGMMPHLGLALNRGVLVAEADEAAARAVLATQEPTEAELIAEEEDDPLTLEEAEQQVQ